MADSGEDDTICPICSKGYRANGENVPKFLPCSHTVCEKCIKRKLLKRDHLDCPQCTGLHFAHDGVGTFPTNKYVLMYIEAKAGKSDIKDQCEVHNREKNVFCNICQIPICVLCLKDGHKNHDFADIEEAKSQRCETLLFFVQLLKKKLARNKKKLTAVQERQRENHNICIDHINSSREELIEMINNRCDELVKEVGDKTSEFDAQVKNLLAQMDGDFDRLYSIGKLPTNEPVTHADITDRMNRIKEIKTNERNTLSKAANYSHFDFEKNQNSVKYVNKICGKLISVDKSIGLAKVNTTPEKNAPGERGKDGTVSNGSARPVISPPEMKSNVGDFAKKGKENNPSKVPTAGSNKSERSPGFPLGAGNALGVYTAARKKSQEFSDIMNAPNIRVTIANTRTSGRANTTPDGPPLNKARVDSSTVYPINCEATLSFDLDEYCVRMMSLSPDGRIIVLGVMKYGNKWFFMVYSIYNGTRLRKIPLQEDDQPNGMAMVNVAGNQCVAVSYRFKRIIDFYDAYILREISYRYQAEELNPGELCTSSSPYTLLLVDYSRESQQVVWFDCSTYPPVLTRITNVMFSVNSENFNHSVCFAALGTKELLITSEFTDGIHAYNAFSDKLEWSVKGQLPGMSWELKAKGLAVDNHGHLYVCDANNKCVHQFTLDGVFLRTPVSFVSKAPLKPVLISWCEKSSSVVVCNAFWSCSCIHVLKM